MRAPHEESPLNPLPPVVVVLALAMGGIEIAFQLGERGLIGGPNAVGWRLAALHQYAFIGDVFDQMWAKNYWPVEHLIRFVTYPFIHATFTQAVFALVFLVALGKMVAEVFSVWAVLVIFFLSAIFGALAFAVLLDDPYPLIGGFPAVYGLIGAYSFMMWAYLDEMGESQLRAFGLIGMLMGIQLLFGLIFGGGKDWVADLAGFTCGFLLSFAVSPGGWARIVERVRQR